MFTSSPISGNSLTPEQATAIADIENKADIVPTATEDNLVSFDANGNIQDSGSKPSDFAASDHNHSTVYAPKFTEVTKATSGTLTASEMDGRMVNNLGQTLDVTITMDPAAKGLHGRIFLSTTVAKYYRLDPNISNCIYLDGTALADGKYVGVASAQAGNCIDYHAWESGTGVYDWAFNTVSGPWAAEA